VVMFLPEGLAGMVDRVRARFLRREER
jgi:hypothetical protein